MQNGTTSHYKRDEKVVKWILNNADGKCESCDDDAPFIKQNNGEPYLEVHHLRRLCDKGSDTITNAIAACPNCHRELHFGKNRNAKLILQGLSKKNLHGFYV